MAEAKEPSNPEHTQTPKRGGGVGGADDRPQFQCHRQTILGGPRRGGQWSRERGHLPRHPVCRPILKNFRSSFRKRIACCARMSPTLRSEQEELRRRLARDLEQRLEIGDRKSPGGFPAGVG